MSAVHADEVINPRQAYPRAVAISAFIIIFSLIFGSLGIAVVVPNSELNVITGISQAFIAFQGALGLPGLAIILTFCLIVGSACSVATWIIGPTKGMMVASKDGCAPEFFSKINEHGAPTNLLILQALIFSVLTCLMVWLPTIESFYTMLTIMTSQLSVVTYLFMISSL